MKAVILAGGLGTRIAEESSVRPKPMVSIGSQPILWHIMKIYESSGITDFIICLGFKGEVIKQYFLDYRERHSNFIVDTHSGDVTLLSHPNEKWKVTLVDTGLNSNTGERLRRTREFLNGEANFCLTYGDGLTDARISDLIKFHEDHGKLATLLAVKPTARFGNLRMKNTQIHVFEEKDPNEAQLVSGGFFVLKNEVLNLIPSNNASWEKDVCPGLASRNELQGYLHHGFWHPMDNLHDSQHLNNLWESGSPPWLAK